MKIFNVLDHYKTENEKTDLIQKCAWRLVRSAEDRMKDNRGQEQMLWCIDRITQKFTDLDKQEAEDYIRSAYFNFKIEKSTLERKQYL